MQYTPILSIVSIILGFYIFASFFFATAPADHHQQRFHMGCFLIQHNLTHSHMLKSAISLISKKKFQNSNHLSSFNAELLDSKLVQLAHSFEFYIQQYTKQKQQKNTYVQLSKTVAKAYQTYRNCSKGLKLLSIFQENKCIQLWSLQQNCSRKIDILKQQLSFLLEEKEQRQQMMKQIINIGKIKTIEIKTVNNNYEKQYKKREKQLQQQEKSIEANIKYLRQRIINLQYNFAVAENQTTHSQWLYKQCSQNRKQFQLCEELSKQVRNLGHGTLQNLSEKVEKKRISIRRIQIMLSDEQNMSDKRQLQLMQNRSMDEYRKLHKIFIQTKAKINKNCGCTEKQQQKLYQNMQNHRKELQQIKRQIMDIQQRENAQISLLQGLKQKKRVLEHQFRQAQKEHAKDPKKQEQKQRAVHMKELEQEVLILRNKSLQYYGKFSALQKQCNESKQQLASYLMNIQQIKSCELKRKLFEAMESQLKKEGKKLSLDIKGKEKLVTQLQQLII